MGQNRIDKNFELGYMGCMDCMDCMGWMGSWMGSGYGNFPYPESIGKFFFCVLHAFNLPINCKLIGTKNTKSKLRISLISISKSDLSSLIDVCKNRQCNTKFNVTV